jgi:predicted dehydrogenase
VSEPKIVVIGAGWSARFVHLAGYRAAGAPVAALCDQQEERAQPLAKEHGIPRVYTDWRRMLAEEQPDVVSVCLPNVLHHEVTIAALDAGAHVLCEKPLATSVAEARGMFDAARRNGRRLMAAQHFRLSAAAQAIKRAVERGDLGRLYYAEAIATRRMGIPTWGNFHQQAFSAGGCLLDIGVHMLDQTMWLMGNPTPARVSAVTQRYFGQRPEIAAAWGNAWDAQRFDVEDFAVAFVRFQDGSSLVLHACWAAYIAQSRFSSVLVGTEGGAITDPPTLYRLCDGKQVVDNEITDLPNVNAYEAELAHWVAVVRGEAEPLVKEEETMNVQRILDAAYRSAAEGREVDVEG